MTETTVRMIIISVTIVVVAVIFAIVILCCKIHNNTTPKERETRERQKTKRKRIEERGKTKRLSKKLKHKENKWHENARIVRAAVSQPEKTKRTQLRTDGMEKIPTIIDSGGNAVDKILRSLKDLLSSIFIGKR